MRQLKPRLHRTGSKPLGQQHSGVNNNDFVDTKSTVPALDRTLRAENVRKMIKRVDKIIKTENGAETKLIKNQKSSPKPTEPLKKKNIIHSLKEEGEEAGECTMSGNKSRINFILFNKWKLMSLQKTRRMNTEETERNREKMKARALKLKQFRDVPSKYMEEFYNRQRIAQNNKNRISGKSFVESTVKRGRVKKKRPQNARMVQSKYMESYSDYLQKSRTIMKKTIKDNRAEQNVTHKRKNIIKSKPKAKSTQLKTKRRIAIVNRVTNKIVSTTFKKILKNKYGNKLKTKKCGNHLKIKSRHMDSFINVVEKGRQLRKQKKPEIKQSNATGRQSTKTVTQMKSYAINNMASTEKNKIKHHLTKLENKKLSRKKLIKKYCWANVDLKQADLDKKYYERYHKWNTLRRPNKPKQPNSC